MVSAEQAKVKLMRILEAKQRLHSDEEGAARSSLARDVQAVLDTATCGAEKHKSAL